MRKRITLLLIAFVVVAPGCRTIATLAAGAAVVAISAAADGPGCELPGDAVVRRAR
ncbi:MAG: hypothetical protein ACYTGN_16370 [Planctomycetota bacterium]|jgi:hypothetical protein